MLYESYLSSYYVLSLYRYLLFMSINIRHTYSKNCTSIGKRTFDYKELIERILKLVLN